MTGVIERLTGDEAGLRRRWEREPLICTGRGDFGDVFSLAAVEDLLREGALVASAVRLFQDGTAIPTEKLTRSRERGAAHAERLVDGAKVAGAIASGATLILEEVRSWSATVDDFAARLSEETGFGAYCAAFLTPPHARGLSPHYDLASVFVMQLHGSKKWRLGRPAERWPRDEWAQRAVAFEDAVEYTLQAGDCLYMPRGFVHVADSTDEPSLHLSIGLAPPTWEAALQRLVRSAAASDEALREALPPEFAGVTDTELGELLVAKVGLLADELKRADPATVAKELAAALRPKRREPFPSGALRGGADGH